MRCCCSPFALANRLRHQGRVARLHGRRRIRDAALWLSDGMDDGQGGGLAAPLYWEDHDGEWRQMTLAGMRPIDPAAPVAHVSYFRG